MNLSSFLKKRIVKEILLLFLLTLVFEIFLFNNRSFSTAGYSEHVPDDSYSVEVSGGFLNEDGDIVMDPGADSVILEIDGFGYPLKDFMIDVECVYDTGASGKKVDACIVEGTAFDDAILELVDDEKNSSLVYGTIMSFKSAVFHNISDSQYIYLKPFGNTKKLKLVLSPSVGDSRELHIHKLVFNAAKPMHLSLIRIFAVFSMLLLLYFSLYNTVLLDVDCMAFDKCRKAVVVSFPTAFFSFFVVWQFLLGALNWASVIKILTGTVAVILTGVLLLITIRKRYQNTSFAFFMLLWGASVSGMYLPAFMNADPAISDAGIPEGMPLFFPYALIGAVYEYLLKPAFIDFGFPFTCFDVCESIHDAGINMHVEMIRGGVISANPFTWSLLLIGHYRQRLKEKRLFKILAVCIVMAAVVMVAATAYTGTIKLIFTFGFTPFIITGAVMIVLEVEEDIKRISDERIRRIAEKCAVLVLLISVFWGMAQIGCSYIDDSVMAAKNTETWYRLYYTFRVL